MAEDKGRKVMSRDFVELADVEAAAVAKRNEVFSHNDMDRAMA